MSCDIESVCLAIKKSIQPYYSKPLGVITLIGSYPGYSKYIRHLNTGVIGHYSQLQDHEMHPTVDYFTEQGLQPVLILIDPEYSDKTSPLIKRIPNYKVHDSIDCQIHITHKNLIIVVIPYEIADEIKILDEFILSQFEKSYDYPTLHFIQYFTGIGHEYTHFTEHHIPNRYQVHSACHYNWGCGFIDFDMSSKISGYTTQSTIFPPIYFNNGIPMFDTIDNTLNIHHLYTKWFQTQSMAVKTYIDYYIGYIKAINYFRFSSEAPFLNFISHIYDPSNIIANATIETNTFIDYNNIKMCLNRTTDPQVLLSSIWMLLYRRSINYINENENRICPERITNINQILSGEIPINQQTIIEMCDLYAIKSDYLKSIVDFLAEWISEKNEKYNNLETYTDNYLNTMSNLLCCICKYMGIKFNIDTTNTTSYKTQIENIQHMTKLIYYYPNC